MLPKKYPVSSHTDHIGPGSTFVAIKGFKKDGTKYIKKAIKLGATKIILDENISQSFTPIKPKTISKKFNKQLLNQKNVEYVFVKNPRKTLAQIASATLNNPASKLKIIGVTGTKGKTTTTYLIEYVLQSLGKKTALLGTIKNKILNQEITASRTTPESDFLHVFFDKCVKQGVEYVVMEISSHALSLHRVYGIEFEVVGFTNLAPEHLDFYENIQNYFDAKFQIFNQIKKNGSAVINSDNEWGKKSFDKLQSSLKLRQTEKANANLKLIKLQKNNFVDIKCPLMFGEFNDYNINMAFLICKQLKNPETKIIDAIKKFKGVPGRLQMHILKNRAKAFVDYAHNPSSMEAVLKALRPHTKDLIVVFGCGGNRDKTKRPIMGKIATQYADKIIITDDNPRFEEPKNILQKILTGIDKQNLNKTICELDRKKAIKIATQICNKNSIIAILGKGHETYHEVKGKKTYLDDFKEICNY